jgi:hypothetical protein
MFRRALLGHDPGMSLGRHLVEAGEHGGLPFHSDCPVCRVQRLHGTVPDPVVVPVRARAGIVAAVLALAPLSTPLAGVASAATPPQTSATDPNYDPDSDPDFAPDPNAPPVPEDDGDVDPDGDLDDLLDPGEDLSDRQLQRDFNAANDRGPQAQASFIPCGPFVAVCVRVAIGVGTKIASKIAGRGSSAVKSVAREAARRKQVSFTKVRNNLQRYANKAKELKRSRAYRKGLYRKVARGLKLGLGLGTLQCAISFAVTLVINRGTIREGIGACVTALASAFAGASTTKDSHKANDSSPSQHRGAYGKPWLKPRAPALATTG